MLASWKQTEQWEEGVHKRRETDAKNEIRETGVEAWVTLVLWLSLQGRGKDLWCVWFMLSKVLSTVLEARVEVRRPLDPTAKRQSYQEHYSKNWWVSISQVGLVEVGRSHGVPRICFGDVQVENENNTKQNKIKQKKPPGTLYVLLVCLNNWLVWKWEKLKKIQVF